MKNTILSPLFGALALTSCSLHASQTDRNDEIFSEAGNSTIASQDKSDPLDLFQPPEIKLENLKRLVKNSELESKYQNEEEFNALFKAVDGLTLNECQQIMDWMRRSGLLEKCQKGKHINALFEAVNGLTLNECQEIMDWMKRLGVWDKCQNGGQISAVFEAVDGLTLNECQEIMDWMKRLGVWDKCRNGKKISELFRSINEVLKEEDRREILSWMEISGGIAKCQDLDDIFHLLETAKEFPEEERQEISDWMKESGIWDKCQKGKQISVLFDIVDELIPDEYQDILNRIKELDLWCKCHDMYDIAALFNTMGDLPFDRIQGILNWMKESGILDKCQTGKEVHDLIETIKELSAKQIQTIVKWMKTSGAWSECKSGEQIRCFFLLFDNLDEAFETFEGSFIRSCLTEKAYWEKLLNWHAGLNHQPARAILKKEQNLPDFVKNIKFYLFCHAFYEPNMTIEETIKNMMLEEKHPENFLRGIVYNIGEGHAFSQECLNWAFEQRLSRNPDDFLAVHQEMMHKRTESVQHNSIPLADGTLLNLDPIRDRHQEDPIPMPVTVWDQLFRKFKKAVTKKEIDFAQITESGEVSLDALMSLQHESLLRNMLDPGSSVLSRQGVDSYSQMLRSILKHVQETDNLDLDLFGQLLINIRTCAAGKLNGIRHTYTLIKANQTLDESVLNRERLGERLAIRFREELRRLREICLKEAVYAITAENNLHDEYYVRGIIGPEIGLMSESEKPRIDMNAHGVSETLRYKDTTKQKLLDMFYQYYKIEDIINKIHTLLNNSTTKGVGPKRQQNLTLPIVNNYLNEAWDGDQNRFNTDLVVLNTENEPVGFTQEAVKRLLVKIGFLKECFISRCEGIN